MALTIFKLLIYGIGIFFIAYLFYLGQFFIRIYQDSKRIEKRAVPLRPGCHDHSMVRHGS